MDSYVEQIFEKKPSAKDKMALAGAIFVTAIGVSMVLFVDFSIGVLVIVVGAFLIYLAKNALAAEYEYEFTNGDCEIAKIINKESRKSCYKFSAGDVQRILPYSSEKFQNELEVNAELTVKDLTSGYEEKEENWYAFMLSVKGGSVAAVLELNEKSLEHVKTSYKQKLET